MKKRKNRNGYGTIFRLSEPKNARAPRSRPFAVRVPVVSYDEFTGEKIVKQKYLDYFSTYEEANACLVEYNKKKAGPAQIDPLLTLEELFERYLYYKTNNKAFNTIKTHKIAFKNCAPLFKIPIRQIKTAELEGFFHLLATQKNMSTLIAVKKILSILFNYALTLELVNTNYCSFIDLDDYKKIPSHIDKTEDKKRDPFLPSEIQYLKEYIKNNKEDNIKDSRIIIFQSLLILLYTGLRPVELLNIEKKDVFLDCEIPYIYIRDAKTPSGIREIPLHKDILELVKSLYNEIKEEDPSRPLIRTITDLKFSYNNFYLQYKRCILGTPINQNRDIYSTRHSFATNLKLLKGDLNNVVFNSVFGHSQKDLASKVYTHITLKDKLELIQKLNYYEEK